MIQVHERLFIGNQNDCYDGFGDEAVVHACKSPCHQRVVKYRGSLSKQHNNYLSLQTENNLYLNMVDPTLPLFMPETFQTFRTFARENYDAGKRVLIHCNQGQSRSPSLALLFLAKDLKVGPGDSFATAAVNFAKRYPNYRPNRGIALFMQKQWENI